jgi:molybdopterin-guanine dinucleotide biosynthesis protein A
MGRLAGRGNTADRARRYPVHSQWTGRRAGSLACRAASNGRVHYLVALRPVARHDELRRFLSVRDRRDVAYFARRISMRRVDFPAAKWDPFFNVNTPEDMAAARAIVEGKT